MTSVSANFHHTSSTVYKVHLGGVFYVFLGLVWSPPQLSLSSLKQTHVRKCQPSEKLGFICQGVKWMDGEVSLVSRDIVFFFFFAEHVDRCSWKHTRVWSYQLTSDLRDIYFFGYAHVACNSRVWRRRVLLLPRQALGRHWQKRHCKIKARF